MIFEIGVKQNINRILTENYNRCKFNSHHLQSFGWPAGSGKCENLSEIGDMGNVLTEIISSLLFSIASFIYS